MTNINTTAKLYILTMLVKHVSGFVLKLDSLICFDMWSHFVDMVVLISKYSAETFSK